MGRKEKSAAASEREEAADDKAGAIQKGDGMAERLPYAPGQARGTPGEEPDCPEEEVRREEGS